MRTTKPPRRSAYGATLIELVVVLTLIGILAAAASVAMKDPVLAYGQANDRAEITDLADMSLRRMGRDIRRALPNSPRVTQAGSSVYLEVLLTRTGGRYRAQGTGNTLDFNTSDTSFQTLGVLNAPSGQSVTAGDVLVVHNLFSAGSNQANAYTYNQGGFNCTVATPSSPNCNSARISAVANGAGFTTITFDARQFPLSSPGNRFHVVEGPVTYICTGGGVNAKGDGVGSLVRVSNYTIAATQPTTSFGGSPTTGVLAQFVSSCAIVYNPLVLAQSLGLVTLQLQLTHNNETVTLYHEVHVSNIP